MSARMHIVRRFQAADGRPAEHQRAFFEAVRIDFQENLEME